jgi:hypothetical protein
MRQCTAVAAIAGTPTSQPQGLRSRRRCQPATAVVRSSSRLLLLLLLPVVAAPGSDSTAAPSTLNALCRGRQLLHVRSTWRRPEAGW